MKLIKAIKIHRKLRIRQEILCDECCRWSQLQYKSDDYKSFPNINKFESINNAVRRVEKKLPSIYFILSDLFGGISSIRKQPK